MLKVQALLHDGSVALEFMTDDIDEAEEMRVQFLDFDRAALIEPLRRLPHSPASRTGPGVVGVLMDTSRRQVQLSFAAAARVSTTRKSKTKTS